MGSPATVAASAVTGVHHRSAGICRSGARNVTTRSTGKVWKFGHDINTDLVIPNFAVLMPVEEQLEHVLLRQPPWLGRRGAAWRRPGCGSQLRCRVGPATSVRLFVGLGVSGIVAESFNGLGLRNCINVGMPSLPCAGVLDVFEEGDVAEVDWTSGAVRNVTKGTTLQGNPVPDSCSRS